YLENKLKKFVIKNSMSDFVKFLGPMTAHSENILNEYRNADIFVHPSVVAYDGGKEGIPGTIVEAMFSGLTVVSTYHAGIPYIIKDGHTGLLAEENDVEKLHNNISMLINNLDMRKKIGENARKFAVENLDLSVKEKELENIYDNLLNIYSLP
ncbi:MAG: glycosyltransferase family 4 protein, partial [Ignavibacteria bacterium]